LIINLNLKDKKAYVNIEINIYSDHVINVNYNKAYHAIILAYHAIIFLSICNM